MSATTVSKRRAQELADELGVVVDKVGGITWWQYAVNSELAPLTLLAHHKDVQAQYERSLDEVAALLAATKLQQYPDWYERLKKTEDSAIRFWRNM